MVDRARHMVLATVRRRGTVVRTLYYEILKTKRSLIAINHSFMPSSAVPAIKGKRQSLGKKPSALASLGTSIKNRKKNKKVPRALVQTEKLPEQLKKKTKKKSENAAPKSSSSAVAGKVGDIVNPLVLNYWNGRGLMEVPRMMLGMRFQNLCFLHLSDTLCSFRREVPR